MGRPGMAERRHGSSGLDSQTLIVGTDGVAPNRVRGYFNGAGYGNMIDGTSDIYGGAQIEQLFWAENGGTGADYITLAIQGSLPNSGWTTMQAKGVNYNRAAANYSLFAGNAVWTWPNLGYTMPSQAFGGGGAACPILFT